MTPSTPFIDRRDGSVDVDEVLSEAIPLARLIGAFVLVAFVPHAIAYLLGPSGLAALFSVVGQFVLAVGAGVVLIYCVARGTAIAAERRGAEPTAE